jgi:hypothetical protein
MQLFACELYNPDNKKEFKCDLKTTRADGLLPLVAEVGLKTDSFADNAVAISYAKDAVEIDLKESRTLAEIGVTENSVILFPKKRAAPVRKRPQKKGDKAEEAASSSGSSLSLDPDTVLQQLEKAKDGDQKAILEFIDKKAKAVLESKGVVNVSEKTLNLVLSRDTLAVLEPTVLDAVLRWGRAQTKKASPTPDELKAALAKVFPLVRVGVLSSKDFANFVVPTGLLTPSETLEWFTYLAKRDSKQGGFVPKEGPIYKERKKMGFNWDPNTQRNFIMSPDNRSVTSAANVTCVATGTETYTEGKHRWDIKIEGQAHMAIGVSRQGLSYTTQICSQADRATSIHGTQSSMSGTGLTSSISSRSVNVVGLLLDMDALRLTYFFDGSEVGSCTIPRDTYSASISTSGSSVSTMTLVDV